MCSGSHQIERGSDGDICGINTCVPFDAGSLRMDEAAGKLYIHTCHEMYGDANGYHHQANMTFVLQELNMQLVDSYTGVMNLSEGYVSHSFNQFIRTDGSYVYRIDHGDDKEAFGHDEIWLEEDGEGLV